ncbi:glycosyltransferase 87 family protein [Tengunoibacter tsumagoiensis]|uniref:DUF2029 domain-containing protein n=1 Tax=Tengunoibacter tsumagoiensis TaxID=2014871 RepID=A0A402A2J0_9CHLR|nr:glycosyltransferase 87 family protein [Tengunoibacter tsumagoiensis]GCE13363.1 hypothetical protein KTT_32220 [Tengunoibacter tsumagoiensis]
MALRSVTAQTALPQQEKQLFSYKWMRAFFTEDVSSANSAVVELQGRAVWIALALIFQSLNEISYITNIAQLGPFRSLLPMVFFLASFYAVWKALRPASTMKTPGQPQLWQRIVLMLMLILTFIGGIQLARCVILSFAPVQFTNDGTSLDTNAAILLLEGRNPYTDSNIPELMRRFNIQPDWTTPLRQGQFANRLDYPQMAELQSVLNTSLKADEVPEFEAKVSYPALSFLTLVPFAVFKHYNVLPFYVLSYLLLVYLAWKAARPELRPWVLLLAIANIPMWASTVGGNLDIFYSLLVVMAWLKRDSRWISALFFGLALASKQIAWYFAPFYMIMLLRHYGLKATIYRMSFAGAVALLINLPFIIWDPQAWFAGVMAPIADPMFPMGVGIINLSVTHLIPYLPTSFYSILEYGGMLGAMIWYWRTCRERPESVMLLAVLPLFLAWRSLASYFYCIAFPIFIIQAARNTSRTKASEEELHTRQTPTISLPTPINA